MNYDIEALKRKMLVKYPFFGSVVSGVDYRENHDIPTAGTDGKTIYYNPDYLRSLTTEEQTFVLSHEVCHIAFNHILRSEGKDPELWNIATDGVINQFLKRDGLTLAEGVVDMAEAINYDAEQLYEKLLQEKRQRQQEQQNGHGNGQSGRGNQQQNQQQSGSRGQSENGQQQSQSQQQSGNSQNQNQENQQQSGVSGQSGDDQQQSQSRQQSGSGGGSSHEQEKQSQERSSGGDGEDSQEEEKQQDVGHDTHSLWEEAVKKHKEEKQQSKSPEKKKSIFDKLFNKNKDKDKEKTEKSELEKKQEELEQMGEKNAFKKNLEDRKTQLEELKKSIAKAASTAGTTTNREIRKVDDIGTAKSLIDWRYVLREAIKYDVDWSYKNATIEDGVVSANLEEQPIPETEIVLDTSGSIDEVLLKNFLRECKNILMHSKLKVGCFDTEFYGFHEIRTEDDIENMQFEGGGGTDFDAAVNAFSRRVENKIIFTDGKASMPNMPLDAIWIVFGEGQINPRGGKVIYINQEQLDKLCSLEVRGRTR